MALVLAMALLTVFLATNPAAAQQAEKPPAPASSTADAVPSADEAYRKGKEFEDKKNYVEAMRWYRMAADRGYARAQLAVGDLYAGGHGVPQDYSEAVRWFRPAADQGNSNAKNDVGFFYLAGLGVSPDYAEGLRWLHKAADRGDTNGKNALIGLGAK